MVQATNDMWLRLLRWCFFGVVISLLPLGYSYENLLLRSQAASVAKIVGNGELLVIVWALCAGALGELFGSSANYKAWKIFAGACTLFILINSALVFAGLTEAKVAGEPIDETRLVWTSFFSLIFRINFLRKLHSAFGDLTNHDCKCGNVSSCGIGIGGSWRRDFGDLRLVPHEALQGHRGQSV
jgi:hypothetical protein